MLENTECAIKNGQSRQTKKRSLNRSNIGYTRRWKNKQYVFDTTIHKQTQIT